MNYPFKAGCILIDSQYRMCHYRYSCVVESFYRYIVIVLSLNGPLYK